MGLAQNSFGIAPCSNILHQGLNTIVVPDPFVASLFNTRATLGNSPKSLWDWCWVVQVHFGEVLLDGISGCLGLVVRNRRIEMVGNMCCTNFVVQKVNKSPWIELIVRTIDCVQSSLYKVVFVVGKVRNIDVRVLEPETRFENSKIRKLTLSRKIKSALS